MEMAERLGAILRALQVTEIEYSLSGGGDSGETTLERVTYRKDPQAHDLPDIPIFIGDRGEIRHLPELLENIVADMSYREDGDYGDDDDEEQFVDDDLIDDEGDSPLSVAVQVQVRVGEVAP